MDRQHQDRRSTSCHRLETSGEWLSIVSELFLAAIIWGVLCASHTIGSIDAGDSFSCLNPDGQTVQFQSLSEVEEFLKTAEIIKSEPIGTGVTCPVRVTLEHGAVRLRAIFRNVDIRKREGPGPDGRMRLNFRDCSRYECAAYKLDRLLRFDSVPPAVSRRIEGRTGTLQLWVEHAVSETERVRSGRRPDRMWPWVMQHAMLRLFDELIGNDDRNPGNVLIDGSWRLWFIDHTRAFRTDRVLRCPSRIRYCERGVWEQLRTVADSGIRDAVGSFLERDEVESLLQRRQLICRLLERRVAEYGESGVFYQLDRSVGPSEQASVPAACLNQWGGSGR